MSSQSQAVALDAESVAVGGKSCQQSKPRGELRLLMSRYRWQILLTYGLFNVENLLRLAQPLLLGWAINGLLRTSYTGLMVFVGGHVAHLLIRWLRQMYDTRIFTRIYAQRASELVVGQRGEGVDVSRVAARSTLSREFVDFFERHVPMVIRSLYSIVGALVLLALFDPLLVLFCLALAVPALVLNFIYGRRALRLSGLLHDCLEREVSVLDRADGEEVRSHYDDTSRWRIKLSDAEALTMGLMEFFVLGLMVAALVRYCSLPGVAAGDIFAVFRYVLMFVMAADSAPKLVQQASRLRDIGRRMKPGRLAS